MKKHSRRLFPWQKVTLICLPVALLGCQASIQVPTPVSPTFASESSGAFGIESEFVIRGVAQADSLTSFYNNSGCEGDPLATADAKTFASGVTIPVTQDQTKIYARSSVGSRVSACSTQNASYARVWWTWASGSGAPPYTGTYGTKGVTSPSNVLEGRCNARASVDRNGLIRIFGGDSATGYGDKNDMWTFDLHTKLWTWVGGSSGSNDAGDLGVMGVTASTNHPKARAGFPTWSQPDGSFYLFGGFNLSDGGATSEMWKYDSLTGHWTWLQGSTAINNAGSVGSLGVPSTTNYPRSRLDSMSFTAKDGTFWLFGGVGFRQDLWRFNPATLEWTWVAGSLTNHAQGSYGTQGVFAANNTPTSRSNRCGWTTSDGHFWIYGGHGPDLTNTSRYFADMWSFDPAIEQWKYVTGSLAHSQNASYGQKGVPDSIHHPGSRRNFACWVDSKDRLWLFGGMGFDEVSATPKSMSDLWVYDTKSSQWTWMGGPTLGDQFSDLGSLGVSHIQNHPGARRNAIEATGTDGRLWIFGGLGLGASGGSSMLNDAWSIPIP